MIAFCGLICTECPVHEATQKDDDVLRAKTARKWNNHFGWNLTPIDINCDGCLTVGGRIFGYCSDCEIRTCARDRGMVNCGHCPEYACEKLEAFWKLAPSGRKVLDKVRADLG